MNKNQIIEVLNEWNFWKKEPKTGIKREKYINKIRKFSNTGQIVSIVGARRSGKSTLMLQYMKELVEKGVDPKNLIYVNFEDPRFSGKLSLSLLQDIYETYLEYLEPDKKPYIFFDEIQNVHSWEKFVRSLHERQIASVFVSGSSSKLLSSEFGSVLTGRHITLTVYPLSFDEFLFFKGIKIAGKLDAVDQKIKIKKLFKEYLQFGGFPKVVLSEEKKEILSGYFDDIINRDVVERYKVKEIEKLKTLAKFYFTNISSLISFNKIKNFLGISLNTIERFSHNLTYPYLIFFVKKFAYSLKAQEVNPRKVYSIDTGLRNAVSFTFSEDLGKIYENAVFLELLKNEYEIFYWKDKKECDFIIKKGKDFQAIQVSFNMDNPETRQREIKGLVGAMEKFKLKSGLIIAEDEEKEEVVTGKKIIFTPLWKWLLNL